jgi:hypothetical protein
MDLKKIIADVKTSTPLPESLGDVDEQTRRKVAETAVGWGVSPEEAWAAIRVKQRQADTVDAEATEIARRLRR